MVTTVKCTWSLSTQLCRHDHSLWSGLSSHQLVEVWPYLKERK